MKPDRRSARRIRIALVASAILVVALASWGCGERSGSDAERHVSLEEVFPLDFEGAPESPRGSPIVAMRHDASLFAVAATSSPSALLLFDSAGSYIRALGSRGPGPGELGRVRALAFDLADTLWVFGGGRVDVWDPSFEFVRSFRPEEPMPSIGDPGSDDRSAFPADDERYWIAEFDEYDIRLMDTSGDTLVHLTEAPESFRAASMSEELEGFMDTSPSILDIAQDAEGFLWVLAGIPLEDREALEMVRRGEAGPEIATRFADHVAYVYEPPDFEQVSETRFDYRPLRFLGPEVAYSTVSAGDSMRIDIVRYGLERSEPP